MAKSNRIEELYDWLKVNKIQYSVVDSDVIDIPEFGKAYFKTPNALPTIQSFARIKTAI